MTADSLCVRSTALFVVGVATASSSFRLPFCLLPVTACGLITTTICPCSTAEFGKQEPRDGFPIEPSPYPATGIRICILPVTFLPSRSFALGWGGDYKRHSLVVSLLSHMTELRGGQILKVCKITYTSS
ncbi:hypothetical protein EV426DRAFT_617812 [Tirmania nivea]|nr:hypothetical protein EV426DRAFT_617812 [Tirmania nivea]